MRIGECVMCALCEFGPVCRRTFDYRRVLKLIEFACAEAPRWSGVPETDQRFSGKRPRARPPYEIAMKIQYRFQHTEMERTDNLVRRDHLCACRLFRK